jgi:hypothetical protein
VRVFERLQDDRDHARCVREDVVVPEAQDAPALTFEPRRPACISFALIVLAAISFDDKLMSGVREVDDITAYRMLAAELVSTQAPVA